ncbi:MAG: bifunctional phosphopantothenoylcysteine decarboxylase/phosphopantothenate--cysteine ligase CoaBC [Bacteroidetes bacterium]|nr:bifunctional phosphopantothenoylcysteine decarboxylase/phosphopantothenate--cysteine ligase CoaBC [Bacteroidota bacterium]
MLKNKKILLGITGSIAAYKIILLVRMLMKENAEIKIIMTPAATQFVSPLVLSTLIQDKVAIDFFSENTWANHVMLGRWADVFIIAPLSVNTLSKMANGQCDNLLLATYLSATCPVLVAPGMDEDMWHHAATRKNIETLKSYGNHILTVQKGFLASGLQGEGRMEEPENILLYLKENFFRGNQLQGKKVLITAGPTYEAIDPVRFIGNHSSGKMGFALADAFYEQGAEVTLVSGPVHLGKSYRGIQLISLHSANEMYNACMDIFEEMDIAVMCAAVADFQPETVSKEKLKKKDQGLELTLIQTQDILKSLGALKKPNQFLVGFALETENENKNALQKLVSKNADMIVLNSLRDKGAGFGTDTNAVTILDKSGNETTLPLETKKEIAQKIIQIIIQKAHA